MCKNIEDAKNMSLLEWIDAVKTDGLWDFKKDDPLFEAYGNYHYGVAGRANGWSPGTLERAAGFYQQWSGTGNDPTWGAPWDLTPPYRDDPIDQHWIDEGIRDFDSGYWEKQCGCLRK